MKVLVFSNHYLPGFKAGGPVRSLQNLFKTFSKDFDFYLFTSDRDYQDTEPYPNIAVDRWTEEHPTVFYSSRSLEQKIYFQLLEDVKPDMVYLNSLFSSQSRTVFLSHLLRAGGAPKVLAAPRGELSPGALQIKPTKKKLFLRVFKFLGLHKKVQWHASSEMEKVDIQNSMGKDVSIHVASNLVDASPYGRVHEIEKTPEDLRVVFCSRLSRKKNLSYAIQCLSRVRTQVTFDIYGPAEDFEYAKECQVLIDQLPSHIHVSLKGSLEHDEVPEVLRAYHLFFFPTMGENFGHIIWEALACGCLPVISDQTPWRRIGELGIGCVHPLDQKERFVESINFFQKMDASEFMERKRRAVAFALEEANATSTLESYRRMFHEVR